MSAFNFKIKTTADVETDSFLGNILNLIDNTFTDVTLQSPEISVSEERESVDINPTVYYHISMLNENREILRQFRDRRNLIDEAIASINSFSDIRVSSVYYRNKHFTNTTKMLNVAAILEIKGSKSVSSSEIKSKLYNVFSSNTFTNLTVFADEPDDISILKIELNYSSDKNDTRFTGPLTLLQVANTVKFDDEIQYSLCKKLNFGARALKMAVNQAPNEDVVENIFTN